MKNHLPIIDLRSDTVTRPTPEMRRAMAEAEVGDDVYGEDPTVNRLEEVASEKVGTEAALFVPTGTMGNQVALAVHARPGEEVICDSESHIIHYEMGAMAALSGLLPRIVHTAGTFPTADDIRSAIQPDISYLARTGVVSLENSHNRGGGMVMSLDAKRRIQETAREAGIPVHLDGARIFNAAAALNVDAREVAEGCDSVMFCLSKGLGAPVGSLLCGSGEFIAEARRVRKRFGGGMRQVGILAAAGLVALEMMTQRLSDDHETASLLAQGLSKVPGITIPVLPETNILIFEVDPGWPGLREDGADDYAGEFARHLKNNGILALALDRRKVRMVTHYDLPEGAVQRTIKAVLSAED